MIISHTNWSDGAIDLPPDGKDISPYSLSYADSGRLLFDRREVRGLAILVALAGRGRDDDDGSSSGRAGVIGASYPGPVGNETTDSGVELNFSAIWRVRAELTTHHSDSPPSDSVEASDRETDRVLWM